MKDVYGGTIFGRKSFIRRVVQQLKDTERKEISHRKALRSSPIDLDAICALIALQYEVPRETVRTSSPYRAYAIYLARKHTALSNPEIGAYFGNITFSAVTKTVSRLRTRLNQDQGMEEELLTLEQHLSSVKG